MAMSIPTPKSGSTSRSLPLLVHPNPGACSLLFLRRLIFRLLPPVSLFHSLFRESFLLLSVFLLPIPGAFNDDMFWLRILGFGFCRYNNFPLFDFNNCFRQSCFFTWIYSISRRTGYFPLKHVFFCLNWLFSRFGSTVWTHEGRFKKRIKKNEVGR